MKEKTSTWRVCTKGHRYQKSSDCPTCPFCESERKPVNGFLSGLAAPARRALEGARIRSLQDLAKWREVDLLKLHGLGPGSIPKLRKLLKEEGLFLKR